MASLLRRISDTLFHVFERRDLSPFEHVPSHALPIYGVYHVFCDVGWERIVERQLGELKNSGLLDASSKLYVSMIVKNNQDVEKLRQMVNDEKLEIIACGNDPTRYEYPALEYVRELSEREDCLVYYFHTKGISYQTMDSTDRQFLSFKRKIVSWCELMEYFCFDKWQVAVNVLSDGYDTYGCYRWPPKNYTMYSGSFWWARSAYIRTLPSFDKQLIATDRFYSEVWLYQHPHHDFSAFDTVADLYFVNIPRSIYADGTPRKLDVIRFVAVYNWRKFLKHAFGYSYKKHCQRKFQKMKKQI